MFYVASWWPKIAPLSKSFSQSLQGLGFLRCAQPHSRSIGKEIGEWSFLTDKHRLTSNTLGTQSDHAAITRSRKDSFRVWFSHRRNAFELRSLSCLLNIPQVHFKSMTLSSGEVYMLFLTFKEKLLRILLGLNGFFARHHSQFYRLPALKSFS